MSVLPEYTFLRIDRDDHVIERVNCDCPSDLEAVRVGSGLAKDGAVEIWLGPLKLVTLGREEWGR